MFSWQSRFATVDYPPRKEQGNLTLQFSKSVFRFHPRGRYRLSTLPLLPRFGIDCNPRHSFPFLSSPPSLFPRYFVSRCFVKGPLLYFSRWLASTDYLAGCHLELRIPDNSFPLMVLYEERLFPPLPPPPPSGVHERLSMEIFGELKSRGTTLFDVEEFIWIYSHLIKR